MLDVLSMEGLGVSFIDWTNRAVAWPRVVPSENEGPSSALVPDLNCPVIPWCKFAAQMTAIDDGERGAHSLAYDMKVRRRMFARKNCNGEPVHSID